MGSCFSIYNISIMVNVPVFAIGEGKELFKHKMNNTEIPVKIIKAGKK